MSKRIWQHPELPADEAGSAIMIFRLMGLMYLVFPSINVLSAYLNSLKKLGLHP